MTVLAKRKLRAARGSGSPNQVLTHAARAAASQLNQAPLVAARGAREGLWLEQRVGYHHDNIERAGQ